MPGQDFSYNPSQMMEYDPTTSEPVKLLQNGNILDYATESIGYTGTPIYNGFLDTEEWVGNIKGVQLYKTIDQMRTDAIIGAIERGYSLPIEQGITYLEYENSKLNINPQFKPILDFVKKDFENINMPLFLHNACLTFHYGFSIHEKLYTEHTSYSNGMEISDGKLHLIDLECRLPKTIWRWRIDSHGKLQQVVQLVYVYGETGAGVGWQMIPIPADKLLLITHMKEGGNFAGKSEYRQFYREWKIKDHVLKQIIITISRVGGGVPWAKLKDDCPDDTPGSTGNQGGLKQIEKALQKLQGSENAYIADKWIEDLKFLTLDPSSIQAMLDTVKYCDEAMYRAAFQNLMALGGQTGSGNRALGDTLEGFHYVGVEQKAKKIASEVSDQVIKQMIDINFGKQEVYPKFKINIQQNPNSIAELMSKMKLAGLYQGNKDTENYYNRMWNTPLTTDENRNEEMARGVTVISSAQAKQLNSPGDSNQDDSNQDVSNLSDQCKHNHIVDINGMIEMADIKPRRNPKKHEVGKMDFEKHADEMNTIKKSLAMELRHVVEPAMIAMGKTLANGAKIYETKVSYGNKAADLYRKYYKRLLEKGKKDIRVELSKQNIKLSDRLYLDDVKKPKPKTNPEFDQWSSDQANIESYMLENDASSAVAKYYATGQAQGLQGEALTAFIIDMITAEKGARYNSAADGIIGAYGMIREISAQEFNDIITSKTRTEIFDKNICEICQDEDGQTYVKAEDGEFYNEQGEPAPEPPFSDCIGSQYGNPCRGIYLYGVD